MPHWKFRTMLKSEKLANPIQSQFFTTKDVTSLSQSLVREAIQNSLDAKDESNKAPVKVRIFLSSNKYALSWDKGKKYFMELIDHLKAENNGIRQEVLPDFRSPIPYLVIEDFNTRGLEGSVLEYDDPEDDGLKHNFFWFWRNVGRTGKKEDDRGRWGLGKTVFAASSTINSYFGLTVRKDDGDKYFMGECVLNIHNDKEGKKQCPYGYFGDYTDTSDIYFASPILMENGVTEFESQFGLERSNHSKAENGLSIVVPFPKEEITYKELIKAVIVQYFYPIIAGQLHVEIYDGATDDSIDLRADTIEDSIKYLEFNEKDKFNKINLGKLFTLAKYAIGIEDDKIIKLSIPSLNNSPIWRKDMYVKDGVKEMIDSKQEDFSNGQIIAFQVPVKVHVKGKQGQMSYFRIFLEKDSELTESDTHFVRSGITIPGIQRPRRKDLRALVVIEDRLLVLLLGDAENPAHTEWQENNSHFEHKYIEGDKVISFVTNSPEKLNDWLMLPPKSHDKEIMKDIFFIEKPQHKSKAPKSKDKPGDDIIIKPNPEVVPSLEGFSVKKIEGGFKISNNPKSTIHTDSINVEVAYMLPVGNPLKKYRIFDFVIDQSPIKIHNEGVTINIKKENAFSMNIINHEYYVEVTGFDAKRDLFIKASSK